MVILQHNMLFEMFIEVQGGGWESFKGAGRVPPAPPPPPNEPLSLVHVIV